MYLLVAMAAINKLLQRALLPQYVGEAANAIFDASPNTTARAEENLFAKAVKALINYFTPQTNREFEIYVFLQVKQESLENHSISHQIKTVSTQL